MTAKRAVDLNVKRHFLLIRIVIFILLIPSLPGCGTIGNQEDHSGRRPYGGVSNTYKAATGQMPVHGGPSPGALLFLDMPFSFVADTLMLPFDICYEHSAKEDTEVKKDSP